MEGAEAKLKAAYADRLPLLAALSKEWDPNGVFVNAFFKRLLLGVEPEKQQLGPEETAAASS